MVLPRWKAYCLFFFGSALEIKENLDEIVLPLLVVVCAVLRELLS